MSQHSMRIFTGSAHPALAREIAKALEVPLGRTTTTHLADSEIHVQVDEVVRDQDIVFIHPCSAPVNDNLSVVISFFPYARQDRMARRRESISARLVANLLESQGADRVIS